MPHERQLKRKRLCLARLLLLDHPQRSPRLWEPFWNRMAESKQAARGLPWQCQQLVVRFSPNSQIIQMTRVLLTLN